MQVNLKQRVRNTRLAQSNSLLPLMEAVVNSIQAIEESENRQLKVYVEIVSFNKLVGDAKKRNAVLFEHLGLV